MLGQKEEGLDWARMVATERPSLRRWDLKWATGPCVSFLVGASVYRDEILRLSLLWSLLCVELCKEKVCILSLRGYESMSAMFGAS